MASGNRRATIPIPTMGVRQDVDPMAMSPEALQTGQNVMVRDLALVPRPAHEHMAWNSNEGWRVHYALDPGQEITSILYDGTRWMYTKANGKIGYTTDFFATPPTEYNVPHGETGAAIFYDSSSFRYCLVTTKPRAYCPPPGVIPMSTIAWGAPVFDPGSTGTPYLFHGVQKDPKWGNLLLCCRADSPIAEWLNYYFSASGSSWAMTAHTSYGKTEPYFGLGGEATETYFLVQLTDGPGAPWPNSIRSLEAKNASTLDWTQEAATSGYSSFVGPDDLTVAVRRTNLTSIVVRSTNLGTAWTTEIDGGGDPEAFMRVFYEPDADSLTLLGPWTDAPLGWPANVWYADCAEHPVALYVDGVLGTEVIVDPEAEHEWQWNAGYGGRIYLNCTHGDPDAVHITPGVQVPGAGPSGAYLAIGSMCYQSPNAEDWIEYAPPPFPPNSVQTAINVDGRWYVFALGGIWRLPDVPFTVMAIPQSVVQFDSNAAVNQIVVATQKGWQTLNAGTGVWTDITDPLLGLTGASRESRTVFRPFVSASGATSWLLGTNGADPPKAWESGLPLYRNMVGAPTYAKCMCISSNRVILANGPSGSPYGIDCSDDLNFDSGWDGLGLTLLADTDGPITALLELNPLQFSVFKTDAIYHGISQVDLGVTLPFRYELVVPGIHGPPSPHCLLRTAKGEQLFLGVDGGIYLYDGTQVHDIGRHARRIIERQADMNKLGNAWGMIDNAERIAYFFFQTLSGSMNRGIAIDVDSGSVWEIALPSAWHAACGASLFVTTGLTWDDVALAWNEMIVSWDSTAKTDFKVFMALESDVWYRQRRDAIASYTDGGNPIHCIWKPGWSLLAPEDYYVTVHEMKHLMSELADGEEFTCHLYGMDDEMDQGAVTDETQGGPRINLTKAYSYYDSDTLDNTKLGYTTEFGVTAQRFTYKMMAAIQKRFKWHGAVARFLPRGLR